MSSATDMPAPEPWRLAGADSSVRSACGAAGEEGAAGSAGAACDPLDSADLVDSAGAGGDVGVDGVAGAAGAACDAAGADSPPDADVEVGVWADPHDDRDDSPTGRTAGRRGEEEGSCVRVPGSVTGENFSVRSVLGVDPGPTPEACAPEVSGPAAAERPVDDTAVEPNPLTGADAGRSDEEPVEVHEESDDDDTDADSVYGFAAVSPVRLPDSDGRWRGSTRSDGTDGRRPAPSSPAGPPPDTANRSSGRLTPIAASCSRSDAISWRRA